jgi:hypothetical protein
MHSKVFFRKLISLFCAGILILSGFFSLPGNNFVTVFGNQTAFAEEQNNNSESETETSPNEGEDVSDNNGSETDENDNGNNNSSEDNNNNDENNNENNNPKPGNPSTADKIPNTNLVVSVKKDGKETASKTYTYAQLVSLSKTKTAYTSLDEDGTPQQILAQGMKLTDLMAKMGVSTDQIKNVWIYSSTEGSRSFTKNFLFGVTRYAFPDLPTAFQNGDLNSAKTTGKTVSPMLAVRCCEKLMTTTENWEDMNYAYGMRICYGQLSPSDTCSTLYGNNIYKITFELKSEKDNSGVGVGEGTQITGGIDDVGKENITVTVDGKTVNVPNTITVRIGYVGYDTYIERKTFTFEELASLPKVKQIYTVLDDDGNLIMDSAVGIRLVDLVAAAGIDLSAVQSFSFHSLDPNVDESVNLQRSLLLDTPRYYYPAMPRKWDPSSKTFSAGAMLGATRVHTILTLKDKYDVGSAVPDYYNVNENNRFRLLMGQANASDTMAENTIRWINMIDIIIAGTPPEEGQGSMVSSVLPTQTNNVASDGSSSSQQEAGEKFNVSENPAPLSENSTIAPRKTIYEISQSVSLPTNNDNINIVAGGFSVLLLFIGLFGHIWLYKKGF